MAENIRGRLHPEVVKAFDSLVEFGQDLYKPIGLVVRAEDDYFRGKLGFEATTKTITTNLASMAKILTDDAAIEASQQAAKRHEWDLLPYNTHSHRSNKQLEDGKPFATGFIAGGLTVIVYHAEFGIAASSKRLPYEKGARRVVEEVLRNPNRFRDLGLSVVDLFYGLHQIPVEKVFNDVTIKEMLFETLEESFGEHRNMLGRNKAPDSGNEVLIYGLDGLRKKNYAKTLVTPTREVISRLFPNKNGSQLIGSEFVFNIQISDFIVAYGGPSNSTHKKPVFYAH